ncbi:Chalcone-flavanone isomerase family protein [Perilla frutescens var. hirtella]|nr:Chalcone-flavanone isomerase family protein [Perilla frutescens var. hirtella]KAH6811133.1 Chalcone-flavanone isomerase family protein [Perilla frutescens var. frutescens]
MSATSSVTQVQVGSVVFPPSVKPPGSNNTLFLGGAGVRGMEIQGNFVKFTAIAVYLEDTAIPALALKWKGKTADQLTDSDDFIAQIITGPFEKLTKVTMILPLTGQQFAEKVAENCTACWKAVGKYGDAESEAIDKFLQVFKDESFSPGASILYTQSPVGSLTIAFSKDASIPDQGKAVIQNKLLAETILHSIIGKHGVSPAARQSLAARLSHLFNQN